MIAPLAMKGSVMALLDSILQQVAGSPDSVGEIAGKLGIDPALAEKAVVALGQSHAEPGDTVSLAAGKTGLDSGVMGQILSQLGGEGALDQIAGQLTGDSRFAGVLGMLDRDGDGNPLNDIAGMAKGLFGKS